MHHERKRFRGMVGANFCYKFAVHPRESIYYPRRSRKESKTVDRVRDAAVNTRCVFPMLTSVFYPTTDAIAPGIFLSKVNLNYIAVYGAIRNFNKVAVSAFLAAFSKRAEVCWIREQQSDTNGARTPRANRRTLHIRTKRIALEVDRTRVWHLTRNSDINVANSKSRT